MFAFFSPCCRSLGRLFRGQHETVQFYEVAGFNISKQEKIKKLPGEGFFYNNTVSQRCTLQLLKTKLFGLRFNGLRAYLLHF